MERVEIGSVAVFRDLEASKAQALKPLEEAAKVFGAWQAWRENLAAAYGVRDLTKAMRDCEDRNRERGRL